MCAITHGLKEPVILSGIYLSLSISPTLMLVVSSSFIVGIGGTNQAERSQDSTRLLPPTGTYYTIPLRLHLPLRFPSLPPSKSLVDRRVLEHSFVSRVVLLSGDQRRAPREEPHSPSVKCTCFLPSTPQFHPVCGFSLVSSSSYSWSAASRGSPSSRPAWRLPHA